MAGSEQFSKTFDKNSSEIGLKLLKSDGSRLGFFESGLTIACLKAEGNLLSFKDLFMIDKMLGPTMLKSSLRNMVGIKSRLDVVDLIWKYSDKDRFKTGKIAVNFPTDMQGVVRWDNLFYCPIDFFCK